MLRIRNGRSDSAQQSGRFFAGSGGVIAPKRFLDQRLLTEQAPEPALRRSLSRARDCGLDRLKRAFGVPSNRIELRQQPCVHCAEPCRSDPCVFARGKKKLHRRGILTFGDSQRGLAQNPR